MCFAAGLRTCFLANTQMIVVVVKQWRTVTRSAGHGCQTVTHSDPQCGSLWSDTHCGPLWRTQLGTEYHLDASCLREGRHIKEVESEQNGLYSCCVSCLSTKPMQNFKYTDDASCSSHTSLSRLQSIDFHKTQKLSCFSMFCQFKSWLGVTE